MSKYYDFLRQKCQEANWAKMIIDEIEHYQWPDSPPAIEPIFREPTLADVLLAIRLTKIEFIQSYDWYWFWVYRGDWEYDYTWFINLSLSVREWWEEALKFLALELGYKE